MISRFFSEAAAATGCPPKVMTWRKLTRWLLKNTELPLLIDADGLNCVASQPDMLRDASQPVVLTPHPGEMARLTNSSSTEVQANRLERARDFATSFRCYVILKGARTVIAAPDGWAWIGFEVHRIQSGRSWETSTGDQELALVNLSGRYHLKSDRIDLSNEFGGRPNVFAGACHTLYLPPGSDLTVTCVEDGEFAVATAPAQVEHSPFLTLPGQVDMNLRGGDNATRQINDPLPPGSPVDRLVLVEVYTPSGGWSSYPGHKHDVHIEDGRGELVEADLEEVYYYKITSTHSDPFGTYDPDGYAYQRVYTDEASPLHQAGKPIDALVRPRNDCVVLVPEGYHPVVSPPGYVTYYLNVLAGSAQSLANQDDPRYAWVKDTYRTTNPDVPLYRPA